MKKNIAVFALSIGLLGATISSRAGDDELRGRKIKHVLLVSVDGLHSLDVANYVAAHPNSAAGVCGTRGWPMEAYVLRGLHHGARQHRLLRA